MTPQEKEMIIEKVGAVGGCGAKDPWAEVYDQGVDACLDVLEGLEIGEREKVEIPKWFEKYVLNTKGKTAYEKLYNFWRNYDAENCCMSKKHISWVTKHKEIVTEAFLVGYEVDEPLYIMPVPYATHNMYYAVIPSGIIGPVGSKIGATKFTEAEINENFPKIKEFAEKVEE